MSQYFDKDFFRFSLGFLAIVSVSLVIIVATKLYEERDATKAERDNVSVVDAVE